MKEDDSIQPPSLPSQNVDDLFGDGRAYCPPRGTGEIDHMAPLPPVDLDFPFNIPTSDDMAQFDFTTNPMTTNDDGYLREVDNSQLYSNTAISELGEFPDINNEGLDFTGSSAYEDSSLIQAAINRGKQMGLSNMPTTSSSMDQQPPFVTRPGYTSPVFNIPGEESIEDNNKITSIDSPSSTPPNNEGYQFPTELDQHPVGNQSPEYVNTERESDEINIPTHSGTYDEPPLGILTFVPKAKPRENKSDTSANTQQQYYNPNVTTALDRPQLLDPVPRMRMNTSPTHLSNFHPSNPPKRHEPPLPPRNPLRTNSTNNDHTNEPPLPPRNPTRVSSSPVPGAQPSVVHTPPTQRVHSKEQTILDLVRLGYSRSEVVKALAVAGNSVELAKKILESFGSKND